MQFRSRHAAARYALLAGFAGRRGYFLADRGVPVEPLGSPAGWSSIALQILMDEGDGHTALSDRGGNTFDWA